MLKFAYFDVTESSYGNVINIEEKYLRICCWYLSMLTIKCINLPVYFILNLVYKFDNCIGTSQNKIQNRHSWNRFKII